MVPYIGVYVVLYSFSHLCLVCVHFIGPPGKNVRIIKSSDRHIYARTEVKYLVNIEVLIYNGGLGTVYAFLTIKPLFDSIIISEFEEWETKLFGVSVLIPISRHQFYPWQNLF